jgi:hypothetical protein
MATLFQARCALHLPLRVQPWFDAPFSRDVGEYYSRAAENTDGGWYPIGANQYWHNGIHFKTGNRQLVQSVAHGTIVAARLVDDEASDEWRFGSPSFVLVQHRLTLLENPEAREHAGWRRLWPEDVVFWTLYMNVCGADHGGVPWLAAYAPFLALGAPAGTKICRVVAMEDGPVGGRGLNARRGPMPGSTGIGPVIACLPRGTFVQLLGGKSGNYREVRVLGVEGVDTAWIATGKEPTTGLERLVDVSEFAAQVDALRQGKCAHLDLEVRAGEPIARVGCLEPGLLPTPGFHLELFSGTNFVKETTAPWEVLEDDSDDDALAEVGKLLEKINVPGLLARAKALVGMSWDKPSYVSRSQLSSYYAGLDPAAREGLRHVITRNTPFWAVDWGAAMAEGKNEGWRAAVKISKEDVDLAAKYMWWRECEAAKVPLPAKAGEKRLVFHYHPLAALEYMEAHLPRAPIFYVVRDEKTYAVSHPDHLQSGKREKVFVHEQTGPAWDLGIRAVYEGTVGIERTGAPDLWEMLRRDRLRLRGIPTEIPAPPAHVADPPYDAFQRVTLSDSDVRVWSSIWKSEGGLDAVNSYDGAFLSCGPVQQTAGTHHAKGELPGAFHYVAAHAPEAYRRTFGDQGLYTAQVALEDDKGLVGNFALCDPPREPPCGPACAHAKVLSDGTSKKALRELRWARLFVQAIGDTDFRRCFLENALGRASIVRNIRRSAGSVPVRLGDICRSELVLALLLDAHINWPALVTGSNPCWIKAARTAFDKETGPLPAGIPDQTIMAREIIRARNGSAMSDKLHRAAHIVLCVQGLDDALATELRLRDGLPPPVPPAGSPPGTPAPPALPSPTTVEGVLGCTNSAAAARARMREMGGFLVHR